MDPQRLLAMFMPIIDARMAEPEEPESRRRHRRPRAPPRPAVPPLDPARNPLLMVGRVRQSNPGFVTRQAKESALADLRKREVSLPTRHPSGPRHPRVYTLIYQKDSKPLAHRGSPPRPSRHTFRDVNSRAPRFPQLLPPLVPQAGPSRQGRRPQRRSPYDESRRNRARGT
ncbi:hypothetical protein PCANC_08309 [Puccinia coronata f. sp. avenae]|uniref:Uncharacterized protein n=1 Tax=Puccinia coronata f. sp. avenae TaxID=200324 RepID=A0A2N5T0N9_9BASI|nr:hypothetical protein PCANC_08309 [Puccinia coronata f. sp. avenae]